MVGIGRTTRRRTGKFHRVTILISDAGLEIIIFGPAEYNLKLNFWPPSRIVCGCRDLQPAGGDLLSRTMFLVIMVIAAPGIIILSSE